MKRREESHRAVMKRREESHRAAMKRRNESYRSKVADLTKKLREASGNLDVTRDKLNEAHDDLADTYDELAEADDINRQNAAEIEVLGRELNTADLPSPDSAD